MVADIREHLTKKPFVPFTIRTADGQEYPVPTRDHIWLPPRSGRVFVADDKGCAAFLPELLISALIVPTDGRNGSGTDNSA